MTDVQTPIDPATSDTLLEALAEQKAQQTFNPNDEGLLRQMVECLGDSRGVVRLRFAEMLGEIGAPATPVLLEALAEHPNVVVRRAAAKTLTLIAPPEAVPNLIHALLNDEDTVVKGSSVGALARIGEAAVLSLLEILRSPDLPESTKGHAAWALAFIGSDAKEYLYREIKSDSAEVRGAVVGAIAKVAQENPDEGPAFQLLLDALADPSENVRAEAASGLGNLGYKPAIPHLVKLLAHFQGETRKSAALSLMKIGDRSAIAPLEAAQSLEMETNVKVALQLAISQLSKKPAEDDW
ncbi:MAG: HEAT repeat domain-containing protein [Cyanosarcina radialis HA8281-LM2]|jgi:bilin biosynthesis protein|nr:HEAT repeat domain-containing protein [Cyanosarcina radialis HA8281-LM2]